MQFSNFKKRSSNDHRIKKGTSNDTFYSQLDSNVAFTEETSPHFSSKQNLVLHHGASSSPSSRQDRTSETNEPSIIKENDLLKKLLLTMKLHSLRNLLSSKKSLPSSR